MKNRNKASAHSETAEANGAINAINDTFAFIIHPINPKVDVGRKWPWVGKMLTERQVDFLSAYFPPVYCSQVTGARSVDTGRELRGWLIAAPYTPRRMLQLPVETVYRKIVAAGRMAERLGARIVGLGAFTSVVGDAGHTIANRLDVPVTTGDSYTVAVSIEALRRAAETMGINLRNATAAVVGATGAIGSVSAEVLADDVAELTLVGRRAGGLEHVRDRCTQGHANVSISTDIASIRNADLVLSATSAVHALIEPQHLKPGAVVLDVARPPDVSHSVIRKRDDVLVIEGGMVEVPGPVNFHFTFGLPKKMAFACMAETMALAMEGRYEDYTIGRELAAAQVREIAEIASRHGFRLGGLRSFERTVTEDHIARVRQRAFDARKVWAPAGMGN